MKVDGIPSIGRVHPYPGEWRINTEFLRWQDHQLGESDRVIFQGLMFLLLSVDGGKGSGTQIGELHISLDNWQATYQAVNQVLRANVTEDGTLHLDLQVMSRTRLTPDPPPPRYKDELFGKKQFQVDLHLARDSFRTLKGGHTYPIGTSEYQVAEEVYTYVGFFDTASQ